MTTTTTTTTTNQTEREKRQLQMDFLARLPLLHAEAVRIGLYITARALHNAVKASGWEVAGETEKAASYAPDLEKTP